MTFWNKMITSHLKLDILKDTNVNARSIAKYMFEKTLQMFEYKNLPETVPQEIMESYLQSNGVAFFTRVEDNFYVFEGNAGGEYDVYYRPTLFIVSNPYLKFSKDFKINEDGILLRNDKLWAGLSDIISRYSTLMSQNWLTMRTADIMLRITSLLSAQDEKTRASAELYLNNLEKGKIGVIAETAFFDGVKLQSPPTNNGSYLTQFIELQQYLTGSFFQEIGINANFNMKREAINEGESALNEDTLLPLCDNMLQCRKEDIEKINEKYGLNIEVEFSSAWHKTNKELQDEIKQKDEEFSQLKLQNEMLKIQIENLNKEEQEEEKEQETEVSEEQEQEQEEEGDEN